MVVTDADAHGVEQQRKVSNRLIEQLEASLEMAPTSEGEGLADLVLDLMAGVANDLPAFRASREDAASASPHIVAETRMTHALTASVT
ncbi:MAG: hypothetical protein LH481_10960 [Burkholderiales bacterium]|nr:hypothetical protein [Burkholderiales bacterium]